MIEGQTPQPLEVLRTGVKAEEVAIQYFQHEFRKLFPNQEPDFYSTIDNCVNNFPQTLGYKDFWQLLSGISEGYKLKWIYRILTDSQYSWSLERIKIGDITMTGMGPQIDHILKDADLNPIKFSEIWKARPDHTILEAQGIKPRPETDHFPIMLREKDHRLKVFDGMRRTCVAVLQGRQDMIAWVGRITNPEGQIMVNSDKVLFLRVLYDEAPEKDPELLEAIKKVMQAYIKYHRNGKEVVDGVMYRWKQDPELAKVVEEILGNS